MDSFKTNCPHCGQKVEVQESLIGMEVKCPTCQQNFVINAPKKPTIGTTLKQEAEKLRAKMQVPAAPATADNKVSDQSTQYPWGNRYIKLARILAGLLLLGALVCIGDSFYDAFSARRKLLEQLQRQSEKVVQQQQAFSQHFTSLAEVVLTGKHSEAKFKFPDELAMTDNQFNESLMTLDELQESLDTANEYENKLQTISSVMEKYFESSAGKIEKKLRRGEPVRLKQTRGKNRNTSLALKISKEVDFYSAPPSELQDFIEDTIRAIDRLDRAELADVRQELRAMRVGLEFIAQTLCAKNQTLRIHGKKSEQWVATREAGQDKFQFEKNLLRAIRDRLEQLYTYDKIVEGTYLWQLTGELAQLQLTLKNHQTEITNVRNQIKEVFRKAVWNSFRILLTALILAFLIMVFADFLQAHQDTADTLHKIYKRGMPLLVLLITLTGCGPDPQELLETQKVLLTQGAIDSIFAEAIDDPDNEEGATLYGVTGKELIIIKGGDVSCSELPESEHHPVTFARVYNIARQQISIKSINFNPIRKYAKAPYTHRCVMSIQSEIRVAMGENIQGLTVHALTPGNFGTMESSARESWVKDRQRKMPSAQYDHAIVIAATPFEENSEIRTDTQEIVFNGNTKQWEMKKQTAGKNYLAIPARDIRKEHALRQQQGFQKITWSRDNDTRELYLQDIDCEIINKYNSGLLFIEGQWVDKEAYLQTRKLAASMADFPGSDPTEQKVRSFALTITQNPKAFNRAKAIAQLEQFLQKALQTIVNDKKFLKMFSEELKHPNYGIIGADTLASMQETCLQNIARLEKEEKKKLAEKRAASRDLLTAYRKGLTELKELAENNFAGSKNIVRKLGLMEKRDFEAQYRLLLQLHELNRQIPRGMDDLIANNWEIGNYELCIPCRSCSGKGKASCGFCRNSGICPTCKGSGRRTKYNTSLNDGHFSSETTEVACPEKCTYCNGQQNICTSCRGKTGFLNKKTVKQAVKIETAKLITLIESYISQTDQQLESLEE